MSSRERFHAALDLETPDRVPLFYQHLGAAKWILQHTGLKMRDGFHDPDVFARLALAAHELYGFDNVMTGWGDLLVEAKAHGIDWRFPERDFYPRVEKYLDISEVDKIQPVDPMSDPVWSVPLKAARLMMEQIGGEVAVVGCINSPNLIASEIVGMENLMMAYFMEPGAVEHLLNTVVQSSIQYGERIRELGIEDIFIDNATAGGEMVDNAMHEQYDRKYLQQTMDSYHRDGLRTILHNCTEKPLWKSQLETGPTAMHLQLDSIDIQEFFAALKGKTCAMAGIDHKEMLLNQSPDKVEESVKKVFEMWGDDPGLIIAPGCEMPYKVPIENIKRLQESVERYGQRK